MAEGGLEGSWERDCLRVEAELNSSCIEGGEGIHGVRIGYIID